MFGFTPQTFGSAVADAAPELQPSRPPDVGDEQEPNKQGVYSLRGCRCLTVWVETEMFDNPSEASATVISVRVCACVCATHLWANDSLDVLQSCVWGRGGAVWSWACYAVVLVTELPLAHICMGQVTWGEGGGGQVVQNIFYRSFCPAD